MESGLHTHAQYTAYGDTVLQMVESCVPKDRFLCAQKMGSGWDSMYYRIQPLGNLSNPNNRSYVHIILGFRWDSITRIVSASIPRVPKK